MIDSGIVNAAGGGFPPGGAPPGGGWGPPPGAPPGGGGYGPPGAPPGGGYPPGAPPGGGYPPGAPPGGGGYGPPGAPPGGGGYGPPGAPPGGGGYGAPPGGGGYGAPPGGGGYGPPGAPPGGGYGPPGAFGGGFAAPPGQFPSPQGAAASAPGTWSASEAIAFGWNSLMKNFGIGAGMFVAGLIVMVPVVAISFAMTLLLGLAAEIVDPDFMWLANLLLQTGVYAVVLVGTSFVAGGVLDVVLRTARGQMTSFGDFFKGGRYFFSFLVASILLGLIQSVGTMLCVVPGVIAALGLQMTGFCIVDGGMRPLDALKESWRLTTGHKMSLFVFSLLGILVMLAGYIACFVGALLVSAPVLAIAQGYIYLKLKGEQPRLIGT